MCFLEEITDINEQVGESTKMLRELEKATKHAEQEKRDTQAALEEAEVCFTSTNFNILQNKNNINCCFLSEVFLGTRGGQNPAT